MSSETVDVDMRLWLSEDDAWEDAVDHRSTTLRTFALGRTDEALLGRIFSVPEGLTPGMDYSVIVRVEATGRASGGTTTDWVPMRGVVTVDSACP